LPILKGLITSSGGLTESTLKASQNSLFEYLSEMQKSLDKSEGIERKKVFIRKLITIYEQHEKNDRITVPLMKTTEMLLAADYLSEPEIQPLINEIHRLCVAECNKSKNIVKLISGVGVNAGMLTSPKYQIKIIHLIIYFVSYILHLQTCLNFRFLFLNLLVILLKVFS